LKELERYGTQLKHCATLQEARAAAAAAFQDGYSRGREELQTAAKSAAGEPDAATVLGPRDGLPGVGAAIQNLPRTFVEYEQQRADSASVLGSQPHALGYLDYVLHNFNYRLVNTINYLTTYSTTPSRKIDLMVASLVDYDWWLAHGKPTHTPLAEQLDVMARLSVIMGGRVHGFAPFCPFREAMTVRGDGIGDSLRLVQRAIEQHGFMGVKLYPPMGFAAWGNSMLDRWKGKKLPPAAFEPGFGKRLDAAMAALYKWCMANDVPIMAHANRSNGPYDDFKELASSSYWKLALEQFPGLRVSFGHFGDTDPEDHGGKRTEAYIALMTPGPRSNGRNVFADSGYFAGVLTNPTSMVGVLTQFYLGSHGGVLLERLMYGTDWMMTLPQRYVERYLSEFVGVMAQVEENSKASVRNTTLSNAFFSSNAVEYLGLQRDKPRRRLEAFYKRNRVGIPEWMRKLG
jgi:predicted TIM-barrel fold metal-dependent hydrolase